MRASSAGWAGEKGGRALKGRHLILVGGGHAHLETLKGMAGLVSRGHRVTLISPAPCHYYSGMGPGLLSGLYAAHEARFNVRKMAEDGGGTFVEGRVTRVIPESRTLELESGETLGYDVTSFNVGSDVPLDVADRPSPRLIPVKPVSGLLEARRLILEEVSRGAVRVAVIGGGPAGVEVAANAWRLARNERKALQIQLVAGQSVLKGFPPRARLFALRSLSSKGIQVHEGVRVSRVGEEGLKLSDGRVMPCDCAFAAGGILPPAWLRESGLPVAGDGSLLVDRFLRCVARPELFGGGDCVRVEDYELAKVGVHAVGQGRVLGRNLPAALDDGPLRPFVPERHYMLVLNMGDGRGILCKRGLVWEGRWAFLLKDYVDRRFMRGFQVSGECAEPD